MLRSQLMNSASAATRISQGSTFHSAASLELIELQNMMWQLKNDVRERKLHRRILSEMDTLDAQLDSLYVMRCKDVFINPVDRKTLLGMLSRLRKIGGPLEPSPLTDPVIADGEQRELFRIRPKRSGEGVMDSGSSDARLDAIVARSIKFAHGLTGRGQQRPRVVHRPPPQRRPSQKPGDVDPERREQEVKRRMGSQYSLGLVQRLQIEQQERAAKREAESRALQRRVVEHRRGLKREEEKRNKAATLIQRRTKEKLSRIDIPLALPPPPPDPLPKSELVLELEAAMKRTTLVRTGPALAAVNAARADRDSASGTRAEGSR